MSKVPAEIELADRLDLSRGTVKRSIEELVDRGILFRRRGLGTFVAQRRLPRALKLTSLWEDLTRAGRRMGTQVLACRVAKPEAEVAEKLEIAKYDDIIYIERLRLADDRPFALLKNWHPIPLCQPLLNVDLTKRSLYEALRQECGVTLQVARETIQARLPTVAEARQLLIAPGEPVLRVRRQTFADSGHPVEWTDHVYPADQSEFTTVLER
jgi:GntR family transcriptional regulator